MQPAIDELCDWTPQALEIPGSRLVWIDCEMSGLDLSRDRILEIACIITDRNLEPVDEGVSYVVKTEKAVLDGMDQWCTHQHGKTGLTRACLESQNTLGSIDKQLLAYIRDYIPRRGQAILAGNSVHADKAFMNKDLPLTAGHLHYRIVDVSSIKELARRWRPELLDNIPKADDAAAHRAMADIKTSIAELAYYRENFFDLGS